MECMARGLAEEFRDRLPPDFDVFADVSGQDQWGTWIYQPVSRGPHALYSAVLFQADVIAVHFSDNVENRDFQYDEPGSVEDLLVHVVSRFATTGPKANLYARGPDGRRDFRNFYAERDG